MHRRIERWLLYVTSTKVPQRSQHRLSLRVNESFFLSFSFLLIFLFTLSRFFVNWGSKSELFLTTTDLISFFTGLQRFWEQLDLAGKLQPVTGNWFIIGIFDYRA